MAIINKGKNPEQMLKEWEAFIRRVPDIVGRESVNFFKDRFRSSDWVGTHTQPWKRRKKETKKTRGRKILVRSGKLRDSIHVSKKSANSIQITANMPYAKVHNEGFRGSVQIPAHRRRLTRSFTVARMNIKNKKLTLTRQRPTKGSTTSVKAHRMRMNMPRRQFIGDSYYLNRNMERIFTYQMNHIFK